MKLDFSKKSQRRSLLLTSGILFSTLACSPVWASSASVMAKGTHSSANVSAVQQTSKYEGVVIDVNTQEPIIGANIMIKGTTVGAITDIDGKFTLNAKPGDILVFSYIGYKEKTVKLTKVKLLNIEMVEDAQALGEVVVTAFGVGQKKESVVGSITQVKGADLQVPSANLSNSFAGRMAGVTAFQRGGEPGNDGSNFYIRGISTFTATSPLIIIDGVEASQGDLNALD